MSTRNVGFQIGSVGLSLQLPSQRLLAFEDLLEKR
jgi:hypothetical protein